MAVTIRAVERPDQCGRENGLVTDVDPGAAVAPDLRLLRTDDGVSISAMHLPGRSRALAFVVGHGFTGNWRQERVQRIVEALGGEAGAFALDFRGHGRSGGLCTVGELEVLDLATAVRWARSEGYRSVVAVGFSMGASVVVRHAAFTAGTPDGVDAAVAVSGPAFWFYKGTPVMRLVHHLVETRTGRALMRARGIRIASSWPWPEPMQPVDAARQLSEVPMLVVHGDQDKYFPLEHPRALHRALLEAGNPHAELWEIEGMGHAESGIDAQTLQRIGDWSAKITGESR